MSTPAKPEGNTPEKFTRRGDSIVPPTGEELAARGIAQSAAHADRVMPTWTDRAYFVFSSFARGRETFTTEDVRAYACSLGFPAPPDPRAWGHVARRALRAHVVEHAGHVKAKSPGVHGMNVTLWRSRVVKSPRG